PDEEDNASTTKVQVFLPTDHPVLGVLVHPQDGWTAQVTNTKLKTPVKTDDGTITDAASEITFTGGKVAPGQYEDFNVAFGQLPDDTDQLTFKTLQTYSDGKIVRWIEEASGGQEPENPAPVLKLTAKGADEGGSSTASPAGTKGSVSTKPTASASDSTARGFGIAGLVVGVLGLASAAFAVVRGRSTGSRAE
ncbi:YcnI family protein, partial [Streptomyces sp. tea 10]|nr:YcnI family protein [Streptomyces sp. tea 10]